VGGDVMATLAELDEKLAALQREVHGGDLDPSRPEPADLRPGPVAAGRPSDGPAADPPADPAPGGFEAGAPATPAPPRRVPAPAVRTLTVAELSGWRERLRDAVAHLTALQAEIHARIVEAGPPAADPFLPARAPIDPSSGAPVPTPHDRIFDGRVTVDAGPFLDVADVSTFQRALEQVAGAAEVYVTGFELNRAVFELDLAQPVALGREIRAALPFNFAIFEAGHGRLAINVDAAAAPR
jgi:hypothetical protein